MSTLILSLGPGAMVGLLAIGIVVIYRGTGTINLAHGAMATFGAYLYRDLAENLGLPGPLALVTAVVAVGLVGVLVQVLIMRHLQEASTLTKLVASLGVLIVIQECLLLWKGSDSAAVPGVLPTGTVELGGLAVGLDRMLLVVIAVVIAAGLWAVSRFTRFGIATSATAENWTAASVLGLRTERVAIGNWFVGSALAGLAGALLAPISGLNLTILTFFLVPALAAALVGALTSISLTLVGAVVIVVAQSVTTLYTSQPGAADIVPFLVIFVVMMLRGNAIPVRGHVGTRLPAIGRGTVSPMTVAVCSSIALVSIWTWVSDEWVEALITSLSAGLILVSLVVVIGYAGQVSLAQYALAGAGAFVAVHSGATLGWPFLASLLAGVVSAVLIGVLLAVPSIRMRGTSLAVITLGFSVVVYSAVLSRAEVVVVRPPELFGLELNAITEPRSYLTFTVVLTILIMLVVANVRRSPTGLRMVAVRANERAAAALGINVSAVKVGAFAFSGAIAAVGGTLIAYRSPAVTLTNFDVLGSVDVVAWAVIGGIGFLIGPLLGMFFVPGGLGTQLEDVIARDFQYLNLIGGVIVIITLLLHPDGIASLSSHARAGVAGLVARLRRGGGRAGARPGKPAPDADTGGPETGRQGRAVVARPPAAGTAGPSGQVEGADLVVESVGVSFGGVRALDGVSLRVAAGQIHGLIGPNGAGKTTFLDVVSGFARPDTGRVALGEVTLTGLPPYRRARVGLGRSFQSLELINDLAVGETLCAASVTPRFGDFAKHLVRPGQQRLDPATQEAVRTLGLDDIHDAETKNLSAGRQRLVGIAAALAGGPRTVLLDEPAAGLDQIDVAELRELVIDIARNRGIGVLLVEHDVDLVLEISDVVTVLDHGRVIAHGRPGEIRAHQAVIDAYLGVSADDEADDEPAEPASTSGAPQ